MLGIEKDRALSEILGYPGKLTVARFTPILWQ